MISPSDFLRLPYTPDLTRAGITYACRSLAHTYDRMGGSPFVRLRRIVAGKAVELAFRRCLMERGVPFDNLGATPFTDPDHYDIALGGRRCDLKSFLILHKDEIRRLRRDPTGLLDASALVPVDQLSSEQLHDHDLYVFVYVTALVAAEPEEMQRALQAGQPAFCIHPLPVGWMRPAPWIALGRLELKTETSEGLLVEAGGQLENKEFQTERLFLAPGQLARLQTGFYSLAYVYAPRLPDGRLAVRSPARRMLHAIGPEEWGNIWVYGMEIILAGGITRGEFRQSAQLLPAGSRAYPYARTRTDNMALPLSALHPLEDIFDRATRWAKGQD